MLALFALQDAYFDGRYRHHPEGEAFGAPGYARLSFALGDDDLGEGIRRIADAVDG